MCSLIFVLFSVWYRVEWWAGAQQVVPCRIVETVHAGAEIVVPLKDSKDSVLFHAVK